MYLNQTTMKQCRCADLMACNPRELVDLKDIRIDTSLPVWQRMEGFVQQVGNPYLFKVDGLIIKATYLPRADQRLSDVLPGLLIP